MEKKRGVSYLPEDRNYDLYQLACKVTARRFFPNFLNLDATFNQSEEWKADDPKRYQHEVATMGCRTRVFENRSDRKLQSDVEISLSLPLISYAWLSSV